MTAQQQHSAALLPPSSLHHGRLTCRAAHPLLRPPRLPAAETGIPSQDIFFALAAWASFMALTAVDKLAVKGGRKTKTDSA
jgi:hypothetical protein